MSKEDILRYMRTSSKTDDEQILALVDRAIKIVEEKSEPKSLYRIFDCKISESKIEIDGIVFHSKRLAENLKGCKRLVMFGATLGAGIDLEIRIASATDVALAMAIQAASADKIEQICDELEQTIINRHNVALRQRYSPGYFDLDITEQKKFFLLLELQKRIGLTLTDACLMAPSKSVTAFIGIE